LTTLGRELLSRGHKVTVINIEDIRPNIEGAGLEFFSAGAEFMPAGSWAKYWKPIAESAGLKAMLATARAHKLVTRAQCEATPRAHNKTNFTALIVDQIQLQGKILAEYLDVPFVTVAPHLPMNESVSGNLPPPFLPWSVSENIFRRWLHRLGFRVMGLVCLPVIKEANRFAKRWNLKSLKNVEDSFSSLLQLAQMPSSFAGKAVEYKSPVLHFIGSLTDGKVMSADFDWSRIDTSLPLVYASLGTLQNQRPEIYEAILKAFDDVPVQLVLSMGHWKSENALPKANPRHIVVPFAPQAELIEKSAFVLTHSGMNTTLDALRFGKPMIMIPITNDQPAVAKRVEDIGVGILLDLKNLSSEVIRSAAMQMLTDQTFTANAKIAQESLIADGGVKRAADLIEKALR
jgi:MGT family glycosyltransferase